MSEAVAEKKQVRDDEFGIHGNLATQEGEDSFVVLYDSAEDKKQPEEPVSPTLEDLNEEQVISAAASSEAHPEDAYIDEILSSDDLEPQPPLSAIQAAADEDDGPIALTNEELDGILEMGPATEEEFHPDFPVAPEDEVLAPPPLPEDTEVEGFASPRMDDSKPEDTEVEGFASPRMDDSKPEDTEVEGFASPRTDDSKPEDTEVEGLDGTSGAAQNAAATISTQESAFDDDELPIAISDEDLDEILLEEEGGELPLPPADISEEQSALASYEPAVAEPTPAPDEPALTEEEPIALSDDELDHILADAEAGHAESAPELAPHSPEDEILTLDEEPELTLIDDTASPLDAVTEELKPQERAEGGGFFDSDEDEPITLSDEELDGILSTAPEEESAPSDEVRLTEEAQQESHVVEDEEPIALSHEELDGILMDAGETPEEEMPAVEEAPPVQESKGFFDSDEDEPIALSADELDGIAATAVPEEPPPAPTEPAPDFDSRYADVDQMAEGSEPGEPGAADSDAGAPEGTTDEEHAAFAQQSDDAKATAEEEDEGPIALSADELDGIAADAHEVTPEAPMVGLSPLDGSPAEPSLADQTDKPATVFEEDLDAATLIHEDSQAAAPAAAPAPDTEELKSVMSYLDNLLGELPDDVIEKFAQSEYFKLYQKIMDKLGL